MNNDMVSLVSLVIGIVSFAISIVFFFLSSRSEKRNKEILDKINTAIETWQNKIMGTTIELLESQPAIIGSRTYQAESKTKQDFLNNISEQIKYIIEHPATGDAAVSQSHRLQVLLDAFKDNTKSSLPPELLAKFMHPQIPDQKNKATDNPA